jgi:hypothetical protein
MIKFNLVFGYLCFVTTISMLGQLSQDLVHYDFTLASLLRQSALALIGLDLGIFLTQTKALANYSFRDYFSRQAIDVPRIVTVANKFGHLGLILLLCSWIVPFLQT